MATAYERKIVIIDERPLLGDLLKHALHDSLHDITVHVAYDLGKVYADDSQLILFNFMLREKSPAYVDYTLRKIRRCVGRMPLVVLADEANDDFLEIIERHHLRGWIDVSLGFQVLIAAVHMLLLGETFLLRRAPHKHLTTPAADAHGAEPTEPACQTFTERERDILSLLREGKPNKVIAEELHISQSTAKVHLRNMMRKLHVHNRTQVALLSPQ